MTIASICLNIGHILLQGTISYISALTTSCQISPVLILVTQITFESLPSCVFLSTLEEEKMRRRIRQRVCQLTHSDLGVSHGLGKKARPVGTPRGRGESLLPSLHCTTTSRQKSFCTSVLVSMTRHSSGSYNYYTNNNYSVPLALQSQAVDH